MELHLLPMLLCLTIAPVVIGAALPPELYWMSKLPNATMPKAVKLLLSAGNVGNVIRNKPNNQFPFSEDVPNDQLRDDPNNQLRVWTKHVADLLRDDPNNQLRVWTKHVADLLRDDPNNQLRVWTKHVADLLRDDPNNQLRVWTKHVTDLLRDDPNNQLRVWTQHVTDLLRDDPNNQLRVWTKHVTDLLRDDPNNQLRVWTKHVTDLLRDDPNNQLRVWTKHVTDLLRDDPNNQLRVWTKHVTDLLRDDPNNQLRVWTKHVIDLLRDDPNNQLRVWTKHVTDQLRDDPNNQLRVWTKHVTDQLRVDPNNQLRVWTKHVTDQLRDGRLNNQLRAWTDRLLFINENDLHPGTKFEMLFTQSPYSKTLLSREIADTIPFSLDKLSEILKMFSVKSESKEAKIIKSGIHHCEMPSDLKKEEKHCVTSLESMVDFITSKLGTNIKAYSTEVENENDEYQTYTIAPGVKKLSDDAMACHQQHYPYVLFNCHKVGNSNRVYLVPLEGSKGTRVKSIVVCHSDTADWDGKHIAFIQLNIKPGAPVCHFSPADNVVWVPNMDA